MIKFKTTDNHPLDAKLTVINGDEMLCYFAGDQEVIDMEKARSDEMLSHQRSQRKEQRKQNINNITVTTLSGNTFDGDETSQTRMTRAILMMDDIETIAWTLANNTVTNVTKAELREALRLAGQRQTELWQLDK